MFTLAGKISVTLKNQRLTRFGGNNVLGLSAWGSLEYNTPLEDFDEYFYYFALAARVQR
jgi:hypothetical protein